MSLDETAARDLWERYASAWKSASEADKRQILTEATRPDCVYTDPLIQTHGHDQLIGYMTAFHQQIPGGWFRTTHFQFHHGRSIATWDMVDGDGQVVGDRISYGQFEDDRLVAMSGFFATPEGAA